MAIQQYDFVGMKRVKGEKDGRSFDFTTGCFVGGWSEKEVNDNSAKGLNAITPAIPDTYKDILNENNLGKKVELDTYFAKGRINIGYARLVDKK